MFGEKYKDEKVRDHYLKGEFLRAIIMLAYLLAMETYIPIHPLNTENTCVLLFVFLFLVDMVCALLILPWTIGFVEDSLGVSIESEPGGCIYVLGSFFTSKENGILLEKPITHRVFLIVWLLGVLVGVGIASVIIFATGVPSIDVFTRLMV